ncbi:MULTISPECIES: transporter substrate-binding domain-containing protein [unclassified Paracoccus (in: a-proteobacteria)]|uniref:transporter substrate-binding domain-containing protein n=1 Tax=unclassified Paracoccus (in: a-proteobacteria) TaxID=2688777 RepID=UPI001602759E|nr:MULTISPECIES: transporter substrate-binding domain-containing protein [unclassified Paracoccus (in: a-proteobacteria)]MBB1493003.1 transporter substrate-binding domain-containing protein [Paracoccus sp. MC1854]MBB1499549.1 transporter substrate-binding domain-containing protein [Paracoccus sp. MC1862]QQO45132.1 transporter substrate-binding domain-containing protein [Paracoccus sp. MC1862]
MRAAWAILGMAGLLALPSLAGAWTLSVCRAPDAAPYTRADETGIDDRVAAILADAMGAELQFVTLPDRRSRTLRRIMHAGGCDVAISIPDKSEGFQTSQVYYATGFVFMTHNGGAALPASLDDPALKSLWIGVAGDPRHPIPPVMALAKRGLAGQLRYFPQARLDDAGTDGMVQALAAGEIDLAILWGPTAASLAGHEAELRFTLVTPEIDLPVLPMVAMFTIGVRYGDIAFRNDINRALSERWDEIQAVLEDAGIPTRPVTKRSAAHLAETE